MSIHDHNLKLTESQYRDLDEPSYSMLSSIQNDGVDVVGGTKASLDLKFGSLVDVMCFEPQKVGKLFYQANKNDPPTPNVKKICDILIKDIDTTPEGGGIASGPPILGRKRKEMKVSRDLTAYKHRFRELASKVGVYKNYSDEKLEKTITDAGSQYFLEKIVSRGKTFIKPDMWDLALKTASTLKTHAFTGKYFAENVKDIEIIYQYKFSVMLNGRKVKGMLDCLIINYKAKLVIPVDLKTTESSVNQFIYSYLGYGYYIQGALYREALKVICSDDFELQDYEVRPFEFVVISKKNPFKPKIFVVDEDLHTAAFVDGFTDVNGYKRNSVTKLLHMYYDSYDRNKAMYTSLDENNKGREMFTLKEAAHGKV